MKAKMAIAVAIWAMAIQNAVASPEPAQDVLARLRTHVTAHWITAGAPEPATRIGFSATYWSKGAKKAHAKCDGGPVGIVTYTVSKNGFACAVYPHRQLNGDLSERVAVAGPDKPILDYEVQGGGGTIEPDGRGLLLDPNSDNETPESRAAAERSRAMAACQPHDIQEAIMCLDRHWQHSTKDEFASLTATDVISTHFGIGMWIRNNWGLWGGGPLQDFFNAQNVHHPDRMSSLILDAYWLKSKGCSSDWNNTAAITEAFDRALKSGSCMDH